MQCPQSTKCLTNWSRKGDSKASEHEVEYLLNIEYLIQKTVPLIRTHRIASNPKSHICWIYKSQKCWAIVFTEWIMQTHIRFCDTDTLDKNNQKKDKDSYVSMYSCPGSRHSLCDTCSRTCRHCWHKCADNCVPEHMHPHLKRNAPMSDWLKHSQIKNVVLYLSVSNM